jgi:hypothetical protein
MNQRETKVVRIGRTGYIALPKSWLRGNRVGFGDLLLVEYDGYVCVRIPVKRAASAGGVESPADPATQPAHTPEEVAGNDGEVVRP